MRTKLNNEVLRRASVSRHKEARLSLKILQRSLTDIEDLQAVSEALDKLPRSSSLTRLRNRCRRTGRGRGLAGRRFGLSRISTRETMLKSEFPGYFKV